MEKYAKLLQCLRCGHKWFPKSENRPYACPNNHCHSPRWDVPKEKQK